LFDNTASYLIRRPRTQEIHVKTSTAIERMKMFGLRSGGFVEHSDQLYLPREGFWDRTDANRRATLERADRDGHSRFPAFVETVRPVRSDRIFLGLEVEPMVDAPGLGVLEKDAGGYDYMIGAIHQLAEKLTPNLPDEEVERLFLLRIRQLVESGVNILAHPFRYFRKKQNRPAPKSLYEVVADLLAEGGVAAEINYHTNEPDPEFFAICLRKGVTLSLGSDAHALFEVADLHPHLQFLDELGVAGRLEEVLWRPSRGGRPKNRP
jgi:histidinol phosphatase-like PHP family hydrolase